MTRYIYSVSVRFLVSFVSLYFIAFTFSSLAQESGIAPPRLQAPVRNQPLPRINVEQELQEFLRNNKYEGLDTRIAQRIELKTRGSIVEIFNVFGKGLMPKLKLDQSQATDLDAVLKKRVKQRDDLLKHIYVKLAKQKGEVSEKTIQEVVDAFKTKDREYEMELTLELESILDPIQIGKICSIALGDLRPDFARVPLACRYLKLSSEQQAKYETCRIAIEEFSRNIAKVKTGTGKSATQTYGEDGRTVANPSEVLELETLRSQLAINPSQLLVEADNSLDANQYLFVARAQGFVGETESLEQYYHRQSKERQEKLASKLKVFSSFR